MTGGGVFLLLVGVACAVGAALLKRFVASFAGRAPGIVEGDVETASEESSTWSPLVRWTGPTGRETVFRSRVGTGHRFDVGATVTVAFDPTGRRGPQVVEVLEPPVRQLAVAAVVLAVVGVVLLVLGT